MAEKYSLREEPDKTMFVFQKNGKYYGHLIKNRTDKAPAKLHLPACINLNGLPHLNKVRTIETPEVIKPMNQNTQNTQQQAQNVQRMTPKPPLEHKSARSLATNNFMNNPGVLNVSPPQ